MHHVGCMISPELNVVQDRVHDCPEPHMVQGMRNRCNRFIIAVIRDFWAFSEISKKILDKIFELCK
jgi:hypothetical protein